MNKQELIKKYDLILDVKKWEKENNVDIYKNPKWETFYFEWNDLIWPNFMLLDWETYIEIEKVTDEDELKEVDKYNKKAGIYE